MIERADVLAASRRELRALLESGHPIDAARLDDTVYRGISLGLPTWVERMTWKKFAKVFHRDPATCALRGWNMRVEQDGLDRPWRGRVRGGRPWTFGHFAVIDERDRLLLDYGVNRWSDPIRTLRDPLVALHVDSVDLLLGGSYLEIGPARIPTPSYFLLERDRPLAYADVPAATR
ncbi:MAG TPA: hypothetical protein VIV40_02885 [Kofleriaceae bacterium]